MKSLAAVALAATMLTALPAAASTIVFDDDFSTYGAEELNAPDSKFGGNWKTTGGTVDYLAPPGGFSGLCSNGGACVDLDGSTNDAGLFETVQTFGAGVYSVLFGFSGSNRGTTETLTISFGDVIRSITLGANQVGNQASFGTDFLNIAVTGPTTLSFLNAGGDNVGMLLYGVLIERHGDLPAPVPVPAAGGLLLAGLAGLAALRRRKAAV